MTALRSCALIAVLAFSAPTLADPYVAISNTAMAITGDIEFDDAEIVFANGEYLEFSALIADHFMVDGRRVPASVYEIAEPSDPELENGNRLCGSGDVTYLANWASGDLSVIAVFTGDEPPASSDEMCASYSYEPG